MKKFQLFVEEIEKESNMFDEILKMLKGNAEEASRNANIVNIYSVYDKDSKLFGNVFVNMNDDVVKRELKQIIYHDPSHLYATNPDKFILFTLGYYNMYEGVICPNLTPLCDLSELKEGNKNGISNSL